MDVESTNNSGCALSQQVIVYLYDEMGIVKRSDFDRHISGCRQCAADVSEFAATRSAVQQWRKNEFDVLATPRIEIPFEHPNVSLVETLRLFLSLPTGWVTAASAAAVIAVIIGFGFVLFGDLTGGSEIAEQVSAPQVSVPSVEPVRVQSIDAEPIETIEDMVGSTAVAVSAPIRKTQTHVGERSKRPRLDRSRRMASSGSSPNPAPRLEAPRLNDLEEAEDDSLRLTDLFAEIDTSD
ncbi:MAG: hypothetical protein WBD22_14575 [Pyrinomonadaceae bacterium]